MSKEVKNPKVFVWVVNNFHCSFGQYSISWRVSLNKAKTTSTVSMYRKDEFVIFIFFNWCNEFVLVPVTLDISLGREPKSVINDSKYDASLIQILVATYCYLICVVFAPYNVIYVIKVCNSCISHRSKHESF